MNSKRRYQNPKYLVALVLAILAASCDGFSTNSLRATRADAAMYMTPRGSEGGVEQQNRRSILSSLLTTTVAAATGASALFPSEAFADDETMERGGIPLTPFNSLAFNYRDGDSPTVDASTLKEVSIPYSEFLEKLASDQVAFVEFLAPNGDSAYATFKPSGEGDGEGKDNKHIRIGEGYPTEDPGGWSSPAFVIKAVAKKGVPYKFVVPGLSDSFNM